MFFEKFTFSYNPIYIPVEYIRQIWIKFQRTKKLMTEMEYVEKNAKYTNNNSNSNTRWQIVFKAHFLFKTSTWVDGYIPKRSSYFKDGLALYYYIKSQLRGW